MAYWVTFSNGQEACQTYPGKKFDAKAHEIGLPHKTYSWGEAVVWEEVTPEQKVAWAAAKEEILNQEAQEYAEQQWPGKGITLTDRKPLPYGYGKGFGSGSSEGHFCSTPRECAGYSSCPKRYACSE